MPGKLIMVSTPIGNLDDVSQRAIKAFQQADAVVVEDTRVTAKLLNSLNLSKHLIRCDENVIARLTPMLLERIEAGETIIFCSDAGTPSVSDPGAYLVAAARERDIEVEVVPGASAVLTAFVASGFITNSFYFGGFLPRKLGEKNRLFDSLRTLDAVLIFYESPNRTLASLKAIADAFPTREVVLARELTKMHEEVVRMNARDLADEVASRESKLKGEVTIIIGPPSVEETESATSWADIRARATELLRGGMARSAVVKQLTAEFDAPRNALYRVVHKIEI
jgi:16S rRNA (cytidine1402-2'-O)-methyltransferase